jgi:dihydroorotate dehydrogenase/Pyruvate/2-oxoacid:ferredoxin oxidoreductase delta subunit
LADLSVNLKGIKFKNPFLVGSGPTVKNLDQIKAAADSGWAGASMKLAIDPFPYIDLPPRYRWLARERLHIFTAEKRLKAKEALQLMEESRKVRDDFIVIPNITFDGEDYSGWGSLAKSFVDSGARIIELNMCCPNMSFNLSASGTETKKSTGASLGNDLQNLPRVIKIVREAVSVPVIVKFFPEGSLISHSTRIALDAGADAVGHSGNMLGIPDIDIRRPAFSIYRLQDEITLGCLSGPWVRPIALRATYQIRTALGKDAFIIGSGGVNDLESAVQQIMVGSDMVWICTETMLRGFDWFPKMLDALEQYMKEMNFNTIKDFRDILIGNIASAQNLTIHKGYAEADTAKCMSCGRCRMIGHCEAIHKGEGKILIDRKKCLGCSTCVDICPKQVIRMKKDEV